MNLPLIFILLTVMIDAMGIGLIIPVMPDLIQEVEGAGLSDAAIWGGILATIFAAMQFLFGPTIGSLSDGCLESQIASDTALARASGEPAFHRYGKGSPLIDFRLPCGGGIDILIDPAPNRDRLYEAVDALENRRAAELALPLPRKAPNHFLRQRHYIPALRVVLFGEGPEFASFAQLARAAGIAVEAFGKGEGIGLGQAPRDIATDPWTAVLLLFHDHEWEREILRWALDGDAFYIGAQGGGRAREKRALELADMGFDADARARVTSPIGLIPRTRDPEMLALSALSEIAAAYEALHPHGDRP